MRYSILVLILYWNTCLLAQLNHKYNFRHIDQTNGLLHTTVMGIAQDTHGFMWILTLNGLQRYDGSRFVNYPEIIKQSNYGLINDSDLIIDTLKNHIWVIKGDKIERLDLSSFEVITIPLKVLLEEDTLHKPILFITESRDHWLIGERGLIFYPRDTTKNVEGRININPFQSHQHTYIIKDPSSGDFWLPNYHEFFIAEAKSKTIRSSADKKPDHPLLQQLSSQFGNTNMFRFCFMDHDRNLWISTWTHLLHRYNLDTKMLFTYSLKDIKKKQNANEKGDLTLLINAIYEDRQKKLWFVTDFAGLLLYERQQDDFKFITSDEKISNGLRYNFHVFSIFQDNHDNIWLGTDRGISIFNPYKSYFQAIRHVDGEKASLPKHNINDVIETSEREILVATWGGGITVYDSNLNFLRNVHFRGPPEYDLVWSFVELDNGMIWAGTQHGYIHMYDPVTHLFKTIRPKETESSTITVMAKDQHGNILMGLHNGRIAFWNKKENIFYPYDYTATPISLPLQSITGIHIDQSNRCWVVTTSEFKEFDIQKRVLTKIYWPDHVDPEIGLTIRGIEDYSDSVLIIGTTYQGVYFFNKRTQNFSRIQSYDYLNQTSIYATRKDHAGNIWLATNNSILRTNSDGTKHTLFNIDNGIMTTAFVSGKFYELSNGNWVTMTPAELIFFDPVKLGSDHNKSMKVEISGFKVFDEMVNIDSILKNHKSITLPYNKNFITIEFAALDFTDVRQKSYFYRLSGVDQSWIHSTNKQFADYTDLKSGEYIFEVKADNGGGPSEITSVPITISPPWWGTFWFRALTVLAIGSLIYWIVKKRIQTIRKEAELKHQIAETEMMALRSQMNPHFIFNCINSIDAMIQSNDKYRATMYLNKFAKLIRNVLDSSHQNKVPLSKDMETLQLYVDLELFRHQGKFTATIQTEDGLLNDDHRVPPLIIQPFVENAILHGLRHRNDKEGKLQISVSKDANHINYVIEDNGVGRKTFNGELGNHIKGYGMKMSTDRIRLFNNEEIASIHITDLEADGVPSGTRIEVQLNIQ